MMMLQRSPSREKLCEVLQMDDEDRLRELAIQIQASSDRKNPRTKIAINRLLSIVLASRQLNDKIAYLNAKWSSIPDIRSIVAEAVRDRCVEVTNKIDNYDPNYSFIKWVIGLLENRVLDLLRQYRRLNDNISIDSGDPNMSAEIEGILAADRSTDETELARKLREFIKTDPEGHFANEYIKSCPEATLQIILLLWLDNWDWQKIADEFQLKYTTVSSFVYRRIYPKPNESQKIVLYFRKYMCE